jgi:hypothetical protein
MVIKASHASRLSDVVVVGAAVSLTVAGESYFAHPRSVAIAIASVVSVPAVLVAP